MIRPVAMRLRDAAERRPRTCLAALGAILLALNGLALAAHDRWDADWGFVAMVLVQGAVWLLAARLAGRVPGGAMTVAIVLIAAALLRLSVLFEAPLHSTDAYRYVWDGRVQAAGINPYRFVPADPALAHLRDGAIFPRINRADYAVTLYPPAAQAAFRLANLIGDGLWAVKLAWLILEAAMIAVLVHLLRRSGRPAAGVLLYAWHPLPVWEIACDGHVDVGMAAFLVFALAAWAGGRRLLTGALLAGSVLFKPLTLAALPAFWRPWDGRVPAAFVAAVVLAYVPYLGIGTGVVGFLPAYLGEEGIGSGSAFIALQVLSQVFGPLPPAATVAYLALSAILLAGLAVVCVRDPRTDATATAMRAQLLLFAFLLVLSPNYAWYFLVLVPLGALAPWAPARLLTLLALGLHAAGPVDGYPRAMLVQGLIYGTVMISVLWDLYTRRRSRPPILSPGTQP